MSPRILAHWGFDEGRGSSTVEAVSGRPESIEYVFRDARYKPDADPLWRPGVRGNALFFDGYSTWIERPADTISLDPLKLSIEAWVAPNCFEHGHEGRLSALVSQHDSMLREGFQFGLFRHGSFSFQMGTGVDWYEVWSTERRLPRLQWSHVAAVFDGSAGTLALFLNGTRVAVAHLPAGARLRPHRGSLFIGRNSRPASIGGPFKANMFCGLLDELKIHGSVLSESEIRESMHGCLASQPAGRVPEPDLTMNRDRYAGDLHRPRYHFLPPWHWMNEPHGPLHYKGRYHIFYQHNPQGPFWNHIHWGHAVSEDLVHWRDLPCALVPEAGQVDPDGCWSGCTIVGDDGVPTIYYAAGDNGRSPNQAVGMARSTVLRDGNLDLKRWEKHPVPLATQGLGIGRFGEFRDPFVFKDRGTWYMLVTSGVPDKGGTALLYTSTDALRWTYRNPFYVGDLAKYPKTGEAWELPVFLPLGNDREGGEKHILIVNPWFGSPNPYYCKYIFYWVGQFDRERFRFLPDHEEPEVFDLGEHFIGPSAMIDSNGRLIVFTITRDGLGSAGASKAYHAGWIGNAGLPIQIGLRPDGRVGVNPIPELETLRKATLVSLDGLTLEEANRRLAPIRGAMVELRMKLQPEGATQFGVTVRQSPDGQEETRIYFDRGDSSLWADRSRSSLDPDVEKTTTGGKLPIGQEALDLHVYVDYSMVEVYANGMKSLSTRVYPVRHDATRVSLWANGTVRVKSFEAWELSSIYGSP